MSKIVQALLVGMLVTFILDFFLFLGIFVNYTNPLEINLYYNVLFADNQNIFLYALFTLLFGYLVMYTKSVVSVSVISFFSLLALLSLLSPIGNFLGEAMFKKEDVHLKTPKFSYHGDILYRGRTKVTFYDYKFKKILNLEKKNLQGLN